MSMNETVRDTMRKELAQSGSFGVVVGLSCLLGLCFLGAVIPGLYVLMKTHDWPGWMILGLSVGAGWLAADLRAKAVRTETARMDDDTLQFRHGELTTRKLKASVVLYLLVALAVAYLIFRP